MTFETYISNFKKKILEIIQHDCLLEVEKKSYQTLE